MKQFGVGLFSFFLLSVAASLLWLQDECRAALPAQVVGQKVSSRVQYQKSTPRTIKAAVAPATTFPKRIRVNFNPRRATQVPAKVDFVRELKDGLQVIKEKMSLMKKAFSTMVSSFKETHYQQAVKLSAVATDQNTKKGIGFMLNFNYAGSGPLSLGFQGVEIVPVFEGASAALRNVFSTIIDSLVARLSGGNVMKTDHGSVVKSGPIFELLLKISLLADNKKTRLIDDRQFAVELMLLMFRLSQTKGFDTFDKVFAKMPKPLENLFAHVSFEGKSLKVYLQSYWREFQGVIHYDFKVYDTSPITIKQLPKLFQGIAAIFLQAMMDYSAMKNAYLKTEVGKQKYAMYQQSGGVETAAFAQSMPDYVDIEHNAKVRLYNLLIRFKPYRQLKQKILDKVVPLADAILLPLGMKLEDVLPSDDKFPLDQGVPAEDINAALSQDVLFGGGQNSVEVRAKEPVRKQVGQEMVEQENHIDYLYDTFDTFSMLINTDEFTDAQADALEQTFMDHARKAYNMLKNLSNNDIRDFVQILSDAQDKQLVLQKKNVAMVGEFLDKLSVVGFSAE